VFVDAGNFFQLKGQAIHLIVKLASFSRFLVPWMHNNKRGLNWLPPPSINPELHSGATFNVIAKCMFQLNLYENGLSSHFDAKTPSFWFEKCCLSKEAFR
jgi:hypothetical protein